MLLRTVVAEPTRGEGEVDDPGREETLRDCESVTREVRDQSVVVRMFVNAPEIVVPDISPSTTLCTSLSRGSRGLSSPPKT